MTEFTVKRIRHGEYKFTSVKGTEGFIRYTSVGSWIVAANNRSQHFKNFTEATKVAKEL